MYSTFILSSCILNSLLTVRQIVHDEILRIEYSKTFFHIPFICFDMILWPHFDIFSTNPFISTTFLIHFIIDHYNDLLFLFNLSIKRKFLQIYCYTYQTIGVCFFIFTLFLFLLRQCHKIESCLIHRWNVYISSFIILSFKFF